jgi:symplekin
MTPRIHQYIERLMRSRSEIFDGANKKRTMVGPPDGVQEAAKRQKMGEPQVVARIIVPSLGPGTHSLGALFTLTDNLALQGFDATTVPAALAARVTVTALATVPPELLGQAIAGIQNRMVELAAAPPLNPPPLNAHTSPLDVEDDDDEYEPDFYAAEDTEQILNKLDNAPAEEPPAQAPEIVNALATLGTFKLPPPPLLDPDLASRVSQFAVTRVFGPLPTLEDSSRKQKSGINRLAASSFDRDSWLTVIIRIATRGTAGLEDDASTIKDEDFSSLTHKSSLSLSNTIRESLFRYVMEDFRRRIDVAVAWLCEEWYADQLARRTMSESNRSLHYERWAVKLLDSFLPYLTPQDKVLTRFLAEIPELSRELLGKVKDLCRDPATVSLAVTSLLYLVMMRPPAREVALDTVGEIWVECKSCMTLIVNERTAANESIDEDARPIASKYLAKWRPGFMESQAPGADGAAPTTAQGAAKLIAA